MTITAQELNEVHNILAGRPGSQELAEQFASLAASLAAGTITFTQFADKFNGIRTDFVVDHNGLEFADYLLEFEEKLDRMA